MLRYDAYVQTSEVYPGVRYYARAKIGSWHQKFRLFNLLKRQKPQCQREGRSGHENCNRINAQSAVGVAELPSVDEQLVIDDTSPFRS